MSKHVGQFESLRAIAATWVFVFHVTQIAEVPPLPFLDGAVAVDIFIILSGFVITLLVNRKPEPYPDYIFRRLARLYPLYLVALALGWATQSFARAAFEPVLFGGVASEWWYSTVESPDLVKHLTLHLLMLHGVVPDTILPNAASAFQGPLWSISLEWQFYLVAPLLIWLLDIRVARRIPWAAATVAAIFVVHSSIADVWTAPVPSFLPLRIAFFAVGILAAHLWEGARNASAFKVAAIWACWIVPLLASGEPVASFLVFSIVYTAAAAASRGGWASLPNHILLSPPLRWLGERSYGIYVLHMPILLVIAATFVVPHARAWGQPLTIAALLLTYIPIVALSALLYRWVERPVIDWARQVRFASAPAKTAEPARS